ncbi:hypothetical protein, partial [Pseudomonas viridiflava]|uniref:hypothetical protein n=1 Tax=Pseudomonas viridiflava TaxID=33069 RepID=UPI0013DFE9E2
PRAIRIRNEPTAQRGLDFGDSVTTVRSEIDKECATEAILRCLRGQLTWLAKLEIITAASISDGQWNAAINDLISRGLVERQGERRGMHYRCSGDEN